MNIYLEKVSDYNLEAIKEALLPMLSPLIEELEPHAKVLLKPNLLTKATPEEAITTHPLVLEAIILLLKDKTSDIGIIDSPGGSSSLQKIEDIFRASGLTALKEKHGVTLITSTETVDTTLKGKHPVTVPILKAVFDADVVINACKCKTHALMTYTGAVKNQFGVIHGLHKAHQHLRFKDPFHFAEHILDLSLSLPVSYHIIDGITSMEGNGPSGGQPVNTGFLAASKDPYNLDAIVSAMVALPLEKLPSVLESRKRGLLTKDLLFPLKSPEDFSITPLKLPDSALSLGVNLVPSWVPKPIASFIKKNFRSKPFINKTKCIGCKKCADICPAQTITMVHKKASIGYDNCISCFCCHEVCPAKAIDIKRGLFIKKTT